MTNYEFKGKWARKFADAIRSGELSEGQIRGARLKFAKVFNESSAARAVPGCGLHEAARLLDMLQTLKPRVSDEQARKGADWLYNAVFTPRGKVRRTEFAQEFSERDREVIRQLKDNPHFTIARFQNMGTWRTFYVPVYNAIGLDSFFTYAAVAWQSGQSFVISHA